MPAPPPPSPFGDALAVRRHGTMMKRFRDLFVPRMAQVSLLERVRSACGALLGLLCTGLIARAAVGSGPELPILIAPMGAVHYFLLVKANHKPPLVYGAIIAVLLAWHAMNWAGDRKKAAERQAAKAAKAQAARA